MTSSKKTLAIALAALLALAAVGGSLFVGLGIYDVAANSPHTQPVYSLLELAMNRSVRQRAARIQAPPLESPQLVARGALCFRDKCVQCHGGPGTAPGDIGRSMQPLPGPLVDARGRWSASEMYWITRHGITMSGMPAWQHRLRDEDLWAVVAFMQRLPDLNVRDFNQLAGAQVPGRCEAPASNALTQETGNAARGRAALTQYGCNTCHRIPGITGSDVHVGPPLAGMATRQLIAGRLPNTPEQMARWLKDPQAVDPETAMPKLQLTDTDAADIAAYLATLR